MKDMLEKVRSFHVKHGLPNRSAKVGPGKEALLRLRLLNEELGELSSALHDGNIVEVADGLADLMYVTFGAAVTFDLELRATLPKNLTYEPMIPDDEQSSLFLARLTQQVGDFAESVEMSDPLGMKIDLEAIIFACIKLADLLEIPIEAVFNEVHRSNMSKSILKPNRKGGKGPDFTPPNLKPILWP